MIFETDSVPNAREVNSPRLLPRATTVEPEDPLEPTAFVDRTDGASGFADRMRSELGSAAPAVAGYAGLRALCMVVLWLWARSTHVSFAHVVYRYDAGWYVKIASQGYDHLISNGPDGTPFKSSLAFFPLYPLMIRAVVAVLPVSYFLAGMVLDWAFSLIAAWGIFRVGAHLYTRRVGMLAVLLWAALPYAIDESLGLAESLFAALAAWCLYALLTRRWLTAGVLCVIAGLSRPSAVALVAAIGLAALVAVIRRDGPWWRPVLAAVISPLGWVAYIGWVALRLHRIDGYFYVQSHTWRASFDGGRSAWHTAIHALTTRGNTVEAYMVTLFMVVSIVSFVLLVIERQPLAILTYSAVAIVTAVGESNYFNSVPRHLLAAFPLLWPLAAGVARMRARNVVALLALMTCIAAWYGGWLAIVFGYSY